LPATVDSTSVSVPVFLRPPPEQLVAFARTTTRSSTRSPALSAPAPHPPVFSFNVLSVMVAEPREAEILVFARPPPALPSMCESSIVRRPVTEFSIPPTFESETFSTTDDPRTRSTPPLYTPPAPKEL
jgi:hypothetical protein